MDNATPSELTRASLRALVGLVDDLTPGQRWTTGLMLGLVAAVLGFGLPSGSSIIVPRVAAETPAATSAPSTTAVAAPPSSAPSTSAPSTAPTFAGSPSPSAPAPVDGPPPSVAPSSSSGGPADPAGPPTVVALVDPDAGAGQRTDEAMARHFLTEVGIDAELVPIGDAFETCEAAAGADLVVASRAVPADVRACLTARGATTIGWDDDVAPGSASIATRRGAARSLLDTARRIADQLTGATALVADERLRPVLEPALGAAERAGLTVDETLWLSEDADLAGVGVDLAGAGVESVVFATTVQRQSTIASQLRLFVPGASFAVLDAADAVADGTYSAAMDGALAVTSVQFPWHPGSASLRSECRDSWQQAQVPPLVLDDAEMLGALLWCQHTRLAVDLISARDWSTGSVALDDEVLSPVTSALRPLGDDGYGPAAFVEASWSAVCGCWSSDDAFTTREAQR